ncbi:hypothetical protein ABZZ17_32785 [Streptomyces sp. NPDC006512]|uniref:hypothetical protein n=1 Tax=Streptomyces sp. NPDC006512 TaxID=3154307 RepID=UPI0033B49D71
MKRTTAAAGAAVALAGLITAAGPAAAAPPLCKPDVLRLQALPDGTSGSPFTDRVNALGRGDLAVGTSKQRPVYWQGTRVYRVPLPAGYTTGEVRSVNAKGLMAGTLKQADGGKRVLFTYQKGAASVRLISAPADSPREGKAFVNDAGRVAGLDGEVPREWVDGKPVRTLELPPGTDPQTKITEINGINGRGDVLGSALVHYEVEEWPGFVYRSYPVVWPAGGGPAQGLPAVSENDYTRTTHPQGIDERGTVVGYESEGWRDVRRDVGHLWKAPYTAAAAAAPDLAGQTELQTSAISPNGKAVVGMAYSWSDFDYPKPTQAAYWTGSGPVKALPTPTAGTHGEATAVSDDDRVAGSEASWTVPHALLVWTCASRQATVPQG